MDTGSTVDTLHAGFSEEHAKGILLVLVCFSVTFDLLPYLHIRAIFYVYIYITHLCASGYRRGLGEGENAKKVRTLVVLEEGQCNTGTECMTLSHFRLHHT